MRPSANIVYAYTNKEETMKINTEIYEVRMYVDWEDDVGLSSNGWEDIRDRLKKLTTLAVIVDGYVEEGYMSFTLEWDGKGISLEELRLLVDKVTQEHLEWVVATFWSE